MPVDVTAIVYRGWTIRVQSEAAYIMDRNLPWKPEGGYPYANAAAAIKAIQENRV